MRRTVLVCIWLLYPLLIGALVYWFQRLRLLGVQYDDWRGLLVLLGLLQGWNVGELLRRPRTLWLAVALSLLGCALGGIAYHNLASGPTNGGHVPWAWIPVLFLLPYLRLRAEVLFERAYAAPSDRRPGLLVRAYVANTDWGGHQWPDYPEAWSAAVDSLLREGRQAQAVLLFEKGLPYHHFLPAAATLLIRLVPVLGAVKGPAREVEFLDRLARKYRRVLLGQAAAEALESLPATD